MVMGPGWADVGRPSRGDGFDGALAPKNRGIMEGFAFLSYIHSITISNLK
jgi:hypothetical protein